MTVKANRVDSRQVEYRGSLDQLTYGNQSAPAELDNLLTSINAETTPLLRIVATSPSSRLVQVQASSVYNPETGRKRSLPPINGLIPNFTSAQIRAPLYSSDSQTLQHFQVSYADGPWSDLKPLFLNPNKYVKVGVNLDPLGKILLTFGSEADSPDTAGTAGSIANTYTIGYFVLHSTSGIVDNIDNSSVFQFIGASGGDGTGTANIFVETLKNQLIDSSYDLLTDNIVYIDGDNKFSSFSGASYDLTTTTIKYTEPGQTSTSINLADPNEFIARGLDINSVAFTAFWDPSSTIQSFNIPVSQTRRGLQASTTAGSPVVNVTATNHGLSSGDRICIVTSSAIGGISASDLSKEVVQITVVDQNSLSYAASNTAAQTTSGYLDYCVFGFAYLISRDGQTYFPADIKRLGESEVYYGTIEFGQSTTQEPLNSPISVVTNSNGPFTRRSLTPGADNRIAQTFTIPAGSAWVLDRVILQGQTTGSPSGNLYASVVKSSNGLPSVSISDSLAKSFPVAASSSSGDVTFQFTRTVLTAGTYHISISSDATYQTQAGYVSFLEESLGGESIYTPSGLWSDSGNSKNLDTAIYGRKIDLRVKLISLGQSAYPCGLEGYGVFYGQQNAGLVTGINKTQRFVFSPSSNQTTFQISSFSPDPDLITCYHVEPGKAYKVPVFQLQGNRAVFPANFFATAGNVATLIFDQNSGGSFDNSNMNSLLLSNNHLGSQDPLLDRSAPGRGPLVRRLDSSFREITIDNDDNIQLLDADGETVAVLGSMGLTFATATNSGQVSTTDQIFAGSKTFNDSSTFLSSSGTVPSAYYDQSGNWNFAGDVTINSSTVNIGNPASPATNLKINSPTVTAPNGLDITTNNLRIAGTGYLKLPQGNDAQRPASPSTGMIRYNTTSDSFEGYASGSWSAIGGSGTIDRITQDNSVAGTSVGLFAVGDVLYLNGGIYTKAIATSGDASEIVGVVSKIIDSNLSTFTFEMTLSGEISGLAGLIPGSVYFLSSTTPGALTTTEPNTVGFVSVPVGVASSSTSLYVAPKRGIVVGGTNARTQLNLSSNATADIFNAAYPSLYQAGELTGWVQLGTSHKFYFRAPFAQNGAGNNWNISPSYVGDTPPAGFSISISNNGAVKVTCPSFSGPGLINYALNAPAVGATFPLAVDAASITTGTLASDVLPSATLSSKGGITLKSPTQTKYTAGSGTYTVPAGVSYLRVRMVGGGGGGGGAGSTGSNGGTGGNTTFGSSFLVAGGGVGGSYTISSATPMSGGAGGSASISAGANGLAVPGSTGAIGITAGGYGPGGFGGSSAFGGAGASRLNSVGSPGATNSGSGGGGAFVVSGYSIAGGGGGGSGAYVDVIIPTPTASYAYTVGAAGSGGAGTSGVAYDGGPGAAGIIIIDEYYY
jgi:hypothetical protein